MPTQTDKVPTPAYGSYKTFTAFMEEQRQAGTPPLRIDRSLMPKLSGSASNELLSTLRFLGLVDPETSAPTQLFTDYIKAEGEGHKHLLIGMLERSYEFLLGRAGFDIKRASGQQVAEIFRETGISGSTLYRAIAFFLAAADDAGLGVSPHVKPPRVSRTNGSKGKKKARASEAGGGVGGDGADGLKPPENSPEGVHRFELPIPDKPSVIVFIPESLDGDDWDMFQKMFDLYVKRWKKFSAAATKKGAADNPDEVMDQ